MTVEEWLGEENQLGTDIWTKKYCNEGESFDEWVGRISGGNEEIAQYIREKKFLFGGRILSNRGLDKEGRKVTYSNCYVVDPPEDNIESIFDCAKKLARTYSYGGGCGVDISKLSPRGARINNAELAGKFIDEQVEAVRKQVGDKKVLLALSGGVDSSVVAALLIKAIGKNLVCVHVNHGLLRKGEPEQVIEVFRNQMNANLVYVDAVDRFLDKLAGVSQPEQKRKIIGAEFIRVFEEEARKQDGIEFLAQGTIYPDILESGPVKAHHNVGGLPEDLKFGLVEPLKFLFKDEVRVVGKALGLPDNMVYRQPFPGPGLGVRCTGAITRDRLEAVRESDAILREEFDKAGLAGKVWQYFTIVPDVKSVGVRDGKRADEWPVVIRAVNTIDAMTAEIEEIPYVLLKKITARITSEVKGVNRVLYDVTPKPTGTIEWE